MKNLELQELSKNEIAEINGGVLFGVECATIGAGLAVAAAVGAVGKWLFDKGEELGKALA